MAEFTCKRCRFRITIINGHVPSDGFCLECRAIEGSQTEEEKRQMSRVFDKPYPPPPEARS